MSPRPGPRLPSVTIRLTEAGRDLIDEWAAEETGGNRSEMIRTLVDEAAAARNKATDSGEPA